MTDTWKSKGCDLDVCIYGTFCNPCLFGENSSHVISYPSCFAQTIAVLFLYYSLNLTGGIIGCSSLDAKDVGSALLSVSCSCLSCVLTSLYTKGIRTRIREKYNIEGADTEDFLLHCLCLPCAVCREAQEIRHRTNGTRLLDDMESMDPPRYQEMKP